MSFKYSRGRNIFDKTPEQREAAVFAEFVAAVTKDRAPTKKDAAYIAGPFNGNGVRCAEGALPRRWVAVDLDRIDAERHPDVRMWFTRFSGCAWPTHSSEPDAPRDRIVIELSRPATRAECIHIGETLSRDLGDEFGGAVLVDKSTFRPEQPVFVPPAGAKIALFDGQPLDVDAYSAAVPAAPLSTAKAAPKATAGLLDQLLSGAELHDSAMRLVAKWVAKGMDDATIRETMSALAEQAKAVRGGARVQALLGRELDRMIDGARRKYRPETVVFDAPISAGETALELLSQEFEEPQHLCDPWIPEGLTIIAARPKIGKSTLERQKLYAVGGGRELFGVPCKQSPALFLSLEEGKRQQKRKFAVFDDAAPLANVRIFYEWPRGDEGVAQLRAYLKQYPEVRYVVIDSLTRFRAVPDARTQAFVADYEAVRALQEVAKEYAGVAIDLVHHTRKMKSDDALDDISGTYGVSAAVDTYWVLRAAVGGVTLHVGGRWWDREDSEFVLVRAHGGWNLTGSPDRLTARQRETLTKVREMGTASPTRLADALGITKQSAAERLQSLQEAGAVQNEKGTYTPL